MPELAEQPVPATVIAAVLWRRLDAVSLDYCRLIELPDGFVLQGRILAVVEERPTDVVYVVFCDRAWITRHVSVMQMHGTATTRVELRHDDRDRWWRDGEHLAALDGVLDIDLSLTPATNTMPIRRFALRPGEDRGVDAAWVRFPALTVERLPQRYTRTGDRAYRYESRGGAFTAPLSVDEHDLVIRYGDIWDRAV